MAGNFNSKESVDRAFAEIIGPQARPDVANTLSDFLWAAPGDHAPGGSAVRYVLGKLWVDMVDPRAGGAH